MQYKNNVTIYIIIYSICNIIIQALQMITNNIRKTVKILPARLARNNCWYRCALFRRLIRFQTRR